MKITYLIRNDEVKDQLAAEDLPKGVARGAVVTHEAEGGKLFFLSFTVDESTIAGARKLAELRDNELRDKLQDDTSTRLLEDEASSKFANALYPRFAEYERKLRCAITLAAYAKPDNFDDRVKSLVKNLEKFTLGELGKRLFDDKSFQDKIKNLTKDPFTKDEVTELPSRSNETTVWLKLFGGEDLLSVRDNPDSPFTIVLFGDEDLSSVRENFRQLREIRNKVMHQLLITERDYDCAREMLRTSIEELDAYIEKVRSDVSYPKRLAALTATASAAKLIRDNYESIFEPFAAIAAAQDLLDLVNVNRELWEPFSKASESIRSIGKLPESIGSFGKLQTPAIVSALENLRPPKMISELQQVISDGPLPSLESLASSFPSWGQGRWLDHPLLGELGELVSIHPLLGASIDTTAFSQAALANIDTEALQTAALSTIGSSALSSLGQMDSSSTDGSDNDLGDVSDDDGKTGSDEK